MIFREDFRPKTLRPWSSIRTGTEGKFDDRVSSKEDFVYGEYIPPVHPSARRETLKTASNDERMGSLTTYRR